MYHRPHKAMAALALTVPLLYGCLGAPATESGGTGITTRDREPVKVLLPELPGEWSDPGVTSTTESVGEGSVELPGAGEQVGGEAPTTAATVPLPAPARASATTTTTTTTTTPSQAVVTTRMEPWPQRTWSMDAPKAFTAPSGSGANTQLSFSQLGGGRQPRSRWYKTTLTVRLAGNPTETDRVVIRDAFNAISSLPGLPALVESYDAQADIVIHYLPVSQWPANFASGTAADGKAIIRPNSQGEIQRGEAVVRSDVGQIRRNRVAVHELLRTLGPIHHGCPSGVLAAEEHTGAGVSRSVDWFIWDFERALLAAWYGSGVPEYMECPAPVWRAAQYGDSIVWCVSTDGTCYFVDDRTGPLVGGRPVAWSTGDAVWAYNPATHAAVSSQSRTYVCERPTLGEPYGRCQAHDLKELPGLAEVTRAERITDGRVLYDHDPRTHVAVSHEGRRLLCQRPVGNVRGGCEYSDAMTVTRPVLYTDGRAVYRGP